MNNIHVVYHKEIPKLKNALLICGFPGSGYVGKLAIDHLIQELDAELIADIYSSALPPQVVIKNDGTIELMKNSLYYCRRDEKDLLLLTGDSQPILPDAEYQLADTIFDIIKSDIDMVFTLAAYITGVFVNKPKVYAAATDKELVADLKRRGLEVMDSGSVTGMNGIIIGLAKLRGNKGICLLGETSGYVIDASASQAVLKALLDIIGIEVDMQDLEKRVKDTEPIIKALEQQMQQQSEVQQPRPSKDLGYIS
ncbi:MAG: proteasome assembly chaperone family protein [Candidatus Nitrosocaldaceae archaeon]|nr:MAG: proteasome assembly chaperone family protein [Candidatus Nitrosocaldaceae archaeon]